MEIYCGNDKILSSIVNDGIREFYTFYKKISPAQKAQKAQDFKQVAFLLLDIFMRTKILYFLFLFAYVRFVLLIPNKRLSSL